MKSLICENEKILKAFHKGFFASITLTDLEAAFEKRNYKTLLITVYIKYENYNLYPNKVFKYTS